MKKLLLTPVLLCMISLSQAQSTCSTAQAVTAGLHPEDTIIGLDIPTPICAANGNNASAGEWYVYTAPQDYTVTVSTDLISNTGKDTRVHIYSGSCGSLVCVGGDDDSGIIGSGLLSIASFPATQGTSYYIAFDDNWSGEGFDFEITESPYIPPNGLSFTPQNVTSSSGGIFNTNMCVVDMNGDYLDDIVTIQSFGSQLTINYQLGSGGFNTETRNVFGSNTNPDWSIAAGDLDKNGYNDLIYGGGQNVQLVFSDSVGFSYTANSFSQFVFSQRTNCVDINNDGHLDAFVCHDIEPNVYFMNDGSNNFNFNQGGIGDLPNGGNYGSIWSDYDNDGDVDLFIAKCRGGGGPAKINEYHRNDGNGLYTDLSTASNLADPVQTWSSAVNDFDNDGDMDIVVGASASSDGMHKVMRNNGDGTFSDVTFGSGFDTFSELSVEFISYDFNNDGFCDVLGGGRIMLGNGDLTFADAGLMQQSGPVGDLNNDGFLDIQVDGDVFFNVGNNNNWIVFNLKGTVSNSNAIGARIEVYSNNNKQIRDVRSGEGFSFMNTLNVHFGLGVNTVDSVIVYWPSGITTNLVNPTINESHLLVETSSSVGIDEVTDIQFELWPNPAKTVLHITNWDEVGKLNIHLYSSNGDIIPPVIGDNGEIDISELAPGVYFLSISSESGGKVLKKFVKE